MSTRYRILFVDDEASIRLTLPRVLEQHGFKVNSAATITEALAEISRQHFEVLISDLNVGKAGDGFRIVSAMREQQPRCIIVILTGYPLFETAVEAIQHQVDEYVVKPVDVDELVRCLRRRLAKKR
jgi:DNA-binding NtrC family response regulator